MADDPAKRRQRSAAYYQRHKVPNGHALARERMARDRKVIGIRSQGREMTQKKRGKPKAKVDVKKLESLVRVGSVMWEMAQQLGVHKDTLLRPEWQAHILKAKAQRNVSLRALQWQSAVSGSERMQRFLGVQWLGQTDYSLMFDPDMPDETPVARHLEIVFVESDGDGHPRRYGRIDDMPEDKSLSADSRVLTNGKP